MELKFRTLNADEIEVRVSRGNAYGVELLLYKDARVDQNILDETVGPLNWQRHHSRDNANCILSIWDEDKKQWIEKEDTGKESYSEAEKGLASDSFKRAAFNWGIGRELYTAPRIFVRANNLKSLKEVKGKWACYDKFEVAEITITPQKRITRLVLTLDGEVVFTFGETDKQAEIKASSVTKVDIKTLQNEIKKKGLTESSILNYYKKHSIESFTFEEFQDAMKLLQRYPDKEA